MGANTRLSALRRLAWQPAGSSSLARQRRSWQSRQAGVGLIEVLVALVVVSFGVLGMAGLQLTGMKHSTNSFNRSKALMLTENMATRMRLNPQGVLDGDYNNFDSQANAAFCNAKPAPYCQASKGAVAQHCSVAELAVFDKFSVACGDWGPGGANAGVHGMLPQGSRLQVLCDDAACAADTSYTLTVSWPERKNSSSEDAPVTRSVQMRLRP